MPAVTDPGPHYGRRGFSLALALSLAAHIGFGMALGVEGFVRLFRPKAMLVRREPPPVRFTLVDTPESAESDAPPDDSRFSSNRNTRAQDTVPDGDDAVEEQPRIEDTGESHDLRPVARAPVVAVPDPAPVSPPAPEPTPAAVAPPTPTPERAPTPPAPAASPAPPPRATPPVAPPVRVARAVELRPAPDRPAAPPEEVVVARPVVPAPPITPLPKKDPTRERRQIAKLEREMAALLTAPEPEQGRASMSRLEAAQLANAQVRGEFSYGAAQHFFAEYLLAMKARVEREWFSRLLTEYSRVARSRAVIDFKVYGNGSVGGLKFVEQEGDEYFSVLCWNAIEAAAPFGPVPYEEVEALPDELRDKPLNIRFTFHYN